MGPMDSLPPTPSLREGEQERTHPPAPSLKEGEVGTLLGEGVRWILGG